MTDVMRGIDKYIQPGPFRALQESLHVYLAGFLRYTSDHNAGCRRNVLRQRRHMKVA